MASKPRVALVGAGVMGSNHARVIAESDRATLAAVVDPRADVGGGLADRFGAAWFPELPDFGTVDAVVVAAATEAHHDLAMRILANDKPLLVEKPVADSLLRTAEILSLADERDIPLMCGFVERYNPAMLTARDADLPSPRTSPPRATLPTRRASARESPGTSWSTTSTWRCG